MLRVLERDGHPQRLRELVSGFRVEERRMTEELRILQARLEAGHREANFHQMRQSPEARTWLDHCRELQEQCDALATELAHCRLAISGTREELAQRQHGQPTPGASHRLGA